MKDRPSEKIAYLSYEGEEYLIDVRLVDQEVFPPRWVSPYRRLDF